MKEEISLLKEAAQRANSTLIGIKIDKTPAISSINDEEKRKILNKLSLKNWDFWQIQLNFGLIRSLYEDEIKRKS